MANDDPKKPATPPQDRSPEGLKNPAPGCEAWEALAAEFQDGILEEEGAAELDRHLRQCPSCALAAEKSRRGQEWLRFLEARPAPPADLFEAILAATSGASLPPAETSAGALQPQFSLPTAAARAGDGPGYRSRLVMTAAMAFFSLAVTIHLVSGFTPSTLAGFRLADLRPTAIGLTVTRRYYALEERSAKFYDNLPVVREAEAEARDLALSTGLLPQGNRSQPDQQKLPPASRNGQAFSIPREADGNMHAGLDVPRTPWSLA
jgi:hypothetical protein